MPSSLCAPKITFKATLTFKTHRGKTTMTKVFNKKNVLQHNLKEAFCGISFDAAVGNKLIEATRKALQAMVIALAEINEIITIIVSSFQRRLPD